MINYIETHILEHCNLNCRGCSHFSGLAHKEFKNIDDYINEMSALSKLTNQGLRIIRVMGGEPLLNPNFVQYYLETRKLFPHSEIVLVSNGTLLKNVTDEQIETLNNANIDLCVSSYGVNVDMDKFKKFKTHYFHNKKELYNISIDLNGSQDIVKSFRDCDIVQHGWLFFKDGRLFQCCIMGNIDYFCDYFNQNIEYDLDDISIDVSTHTLEEVENFLNTPHQVCRYCKPSMRHKTYAPFSTSKKEISEWTLQ